MRLNDDEVTDAATRVVAVNAVASVATAMEACTYRCAREAELQEAVDQVLAAAFGRERVRGQVTRGGDRFDFLLSHPDGVLVVVELKVRGSRADALRQCSGYLERYADVAGLVLGSKKHAVIGGWPPTLCSKPTRAAYLRGWP